MKHGHLQSSTYEKSEKWRQNMANIVDFLIRLKADAKAVSQASRQAEGDLQRVERSANSVGGALRKAFSFSNFSSSLMSIPGMQFLMNPYTIIGSGIGAITALGAQVEQTSVAFKTLVGSETAAADMLRDINDFAAKTPFNNLDLVDNAKMMLSFGVQTNKVVGYLRQLGDIAGGDKNRLNSLALVFGQVQSADKLMGQDLLQFINQGFNPLKELQEMTGKSYAKLQDMMSKGQISADMVAAAIQRATSEGGKFYGMNEQLAETVSGKWSTLIGQIQQYAVAIFDKLQPAILAVMDAVMGTINFLVKWRTEIAYIASVVGVAVVALNAYTIAVTAVSAATRAWAAIQAVMNVILSLNPIGLVVIAVAALAAAVVYCWNKFAVFRAVILTVWDTVKGFGDILKAYIIDRIQTILSGLGKVGSAIAKIFKGDYRGALADAKSGVADLSGVNSAKKLAADTTMLAGGSFAKNLAREQAKQQKGGAKNSAKISTPGTAGSMAMDSILGGNGSVSDAAKSTASAVATGGTRNTTIHMQIGKFFDNINVTMNDKTDTAGIEKTVVECMNRALAIATSTE
jgi:tape measure domain-containing protein